MPDHKTGRVALAALVKRTRSIASKHGATESGFADALGVPAVAVKNVEDLEASDAQVIEVARALERIGRELQAALKTDPEETTAAVKSLFGGVEDDGLYPEVERDALGKRIRPSELPTGDDNRDAMGRSIKKVYG